MRYLLTMITASLLGSWLFVMAAAETPPQPPAHRTEPAPPSPTDNELAWSHWLAGELEGQAEHVLFSGRRVDVLTSELAIEVEWCRREKVAEAIEQASYYGVATGRPGAIVLLVGRGERKAEQLAYDLVVQAAVRGKVRGVAVLDVRDPDVGACCEHLGLVPTTARGPKSWGPVRED